MHVMWAKWAPPLEKSKLSAISYAGKATFDQYCIFCFLGIGPCCVA